MYGPVLQSFPGSDGHLYFINMCSRQTHVNANLTCFDMHGAPIRSFACQRTTHGYAVDLGSTIGFADHKDENTLGLTVHLTHGKHSNGCALNGHPYRSVEIDMQCDPDGGVGEPMSPEKTAVEYPLTTCQYHFVWRSLYACPVCTEADRLTVKGDCQHNNTRTVHYNWKPPKMCHGGIILPTDTVQSCSYNAGEDKWYTSTGFYVGVVMGGMGALALAVYSLVKYYKYKQLYEAYAPQSTPFNPI